MEATGLQSTLSNHQSLRFFLELPAGAPDFCCLGPPNQNTTPIFKKNLDIRLSLQRPNKAADGTIKILLLLRL